MLENSIHEQELLDLMKKILVAFTMPEVNLNANFIKNTLLPAIHNYQNPKANDLWSRVCSIFSTQPASIKEKEQAAFLVNLLTGKNTAITSRNTVLDIQLYYDGCKQQLNDDSRERHKAIIQLCELFLTAVNRCSEIANGARPIEVNSQKFKKM